MCKGIGECRAITLTKDVIDNIVGTSGNDMIIGDAAGTSVADQINGGAGTDTLKLVGTVTKPVSITNVENLILDSTAGDTAFDASTIAGMTSVKLLNHTTDATNSNAKPTTLTLSADQALTLENVQSGDADAGFAQIKYAASVATSSMTLNKAGDAATAGVALTIDLDGAGVKTLNLVTTGTASNVIFDNADTDIAYETINVTGDKNLKATVAASSATKVTVAAGTFTGALNLDLSATENFEVTGGTGDDRFNLGGAFDASDKLAGGAGTDIVAVNTLTGVATWLNGKTSGVANHSSIEVLEYTGTGAIALDASAITLSGLTGYKTTGAIAPTQITGAGSTVGTTAMTVTGQSNAQTFSIEANVTGGTGQANTGGAGGAGGVGVSFAPAVNNGDNTLNLSLKGVTVKGGTGGDGSATNNGGNGGNAADFSNFETINITSTGATATAVNTFTGGSTGTSGGGTAGSTVVVSANAKINISGANEINLGTIASTNQPVTIDAQNLTGKMTVGTGTGADVIKGGSGVNLITLAGGADTVDLSKSTAKADVITVAAASTTASAFAKISGFTNVATNGDKLDVTGTATLVNDAAAGTVAGTGLTASISSGVMTFAGANAATATLADKVAGAVKAGLADAANEIVAFEHAGNTYILSNQANDNTFDAGTDILIELTGVTGITALSTAASAANTIFVA